jgi:hypothetical protein
MEARRAGRTAVALVVLGGVFGVWGLVEQEAAHSRSRACFDPTVFLSGLSCMDLGGVVQLGLSAISFAAAGLSALVAGWLRWRARPSGEPARSATDIRAELDAIERELAALDPPR